MSVDLKTIMDELAKNEVVRAHWSGVQLFVFEPRAQTPMIPLELVEIDLDESGIRILLKER